MHLGLADNQHDASSLLKENGIRLLPAQDYNALGTFGGVISRWTPLLVVENRFAGTRAYAAINEGRGKALRYGSTDRETLSRLAWLESDFAEMLDIAVKLAGGIDLLQILSQALHMGDEGHSRQKAASALFLNSIGPSLVECGRASSDIARALRFLSQNDFFFLPLAMAAAKATMVSIEEIAGSTIVTCMAFNGGSCGIHVSGHGSKWWTAPLPVVHGNYFDPYGAADAGPVIGDSEIAETMGMGAFAMAAAPALARYLGGTFEEAVRFTTEMYQITLAEHPDITLPTLGFRGTPFGIDVRLVAAKGIAPVFSTGIAHKAAGHRPNRNRLRSRASHVFQTCT